MFQSVSGISPQTCTNGFYCKNIGTTDTSINVKNFCKLAHDKEYIFSAMALRRGQKFHIRLEVLDNRNFNLLPSNHLLLPECMLFTEIFAVSGRKFEMGIQECVFFYNDNGEFIMENLSLNESSRIGCVVPHDNLWIVFKCSISFPNLFFVRSPMDTGYNGNYEGNVPVITRLLPGYFDDTSKRNTAVYNDPNNSPETNKLRLKSFLATKGICLGRPFYNSIIPLEDSIIPLQNPILHQQLNNCYIDQTKPLQTEIKILEKSKENEDNKSCVVCLTESKTCLCFPCGHVCFCDKCSKLFSQNNKSCPICRQEIEGICKVYY
ncbi:Zinc finger, RING-type domain and Zinc finger, RING/FYVE/PHD-type domain-containing protein [Strongyloides ratti]|uniref:Zinc finger, RING-type domain and Zinc finger, RING/FYVE/PHD-type domain-containing protein n=1 Tax=Strongyloides ratti TaxID=34506 RepID=A0A090L627_STRRB|nr:Zinc finger, RING-type domain and Zinc finger, RING/FYVE/PHD-type domain-containing protein [Strongyloides ratti]CEF65167.1 Zinc finger, RING-type domain and Zinc finger, RING/FYVE/PHD-type domain-containing protein [Strongyloides ratti]